MIPEVKTLDVEFSEYCDRELISPEKGFEEDTWQACRRKCADLCIQRGLIGMGRSIMKDADGSVDEEWWESHGIQEAFPEIPNSPIGGC